MIIIVLWLGTVVVHHRMVHIVQCIIPTLFSTVLYCTYNLHTTDSSTTKQGRRVLLYFSSIEGSSNTRQGRRVLLHFSGTKDNSNTKQGRRVSLHFSGTKENDTRQ